MTQETKDGYRIKSVFDAEPDYNRKPDPKSDHWCINCHRAINKSRPHRMVHVIHAGSYILHPADEHLYTPDAGDLGFHPFGNDCAKKLGLEWTVPA